MVTTTLETIAHSCVARALLHACRCAFIRTCDAMLHARMSGETFGLAIAEFSAHNRPVLTSSVHHDHHMARSHLDTMRLTAVWIGVLTVCS